jgi:hypothetical protein
MFDENIEKRIRSCRTAIWLGLIGCMVLTVNIDWSSQKSFDAPNLTVALVGMLVIAAFWLLAIALATYAIVMRKRIDRMHLIGGVLPAILLSLPVVPSLVMCL